MKSQGIRIEDSKNGLGCIDLIEILKEIKNKNILYWSILFMDAMGNLGDEKSIPEFENQIRESEKGIFLSWNELYDMATKLEQIIDITIIGCNDIESIRRYDVEQEMYESCDIVIEMIDSGCWEVFSKDESLINRLVAKFKDTKLLRTDFLNQ